MSLTGMPSVMQMTSSIPASAASRMASAAEWRRHEDQRGVALGLLHGIGHRVEHGDALDLLPSLSGCDPGDDLRSISLALGRMERTFLARNPLHHHPRILIDENAHCSLQESYCAIKPIPNISFPTCGLIGPALRLTRRLGARTCQTVAVARRRLCMFEGPLTSVTTDQVCMAEPPEA